MSPDELIALKIWAYETKLAKKSFKLKEPHQKKLG